MLILHFLRSSGLQSNSVHCATVLLVGRLMEPCRLSGMKMKYSISWLTTTGRCLYHPTGRPPCSPFKQAQFLTILPHPVPQQYLLELPWVSPLLAVHLGRQHASGGPNRRTESKERTGTEYLAPLANPKLHVCIRRSLRECKFSGPVVLAMGPKESKTDEKHTEQIQQCRVTWQCCATARTLLQQVIQIERVNSVLNMFLGYLYLVIDVILSI